MTSSLPPPAAHPVAPPHLPVARVSVLALARFRRLMAAQGWAVDLPRMCQDRLYACERMALAHTSTDPRLRAFSLALFAAYEPEPAEARILH